MTNTSREHVVESGHLASIGSSIWRDTYAFVPAQRDEDGRAILAGSTPTAHVDYESARLRWFGEETDFARNNPNRGKVTGVVDGINVYERVINERLPLVGLRLGIARRRATQRVCKILGIDASLHLEHPDYQGLKDHL